MGPILDNVRPQAKAAPVALPPSLRASAHEPAGGRNFAGHILLAALSMWGLVGASALAIVGAYKGAAELCIICCACLALIWSTLRAERRRNA